MTSKCTPLLEVSTYFQRRNMEEFMRDLEEDPEMRSQIELFKVPGVQAPDEEMIDVGEEEEDFPEVKMNELLDAVGALHI